MAELLNDRPLTIDEYLRLEESSTERHEYLAGHVHAMVGVSLVHSLIVTNITGHIWTHARGGPCRIHTGEVKLRAAEQIVYYPDVMVACGERPEHPFFVHAPCLVVEVLSPGTWSTDRREKAMVYRSIESARTYLVVHQSHRRVETHYRDVHGSWRYADLTGEARISIPCPVFELTLDEVYEGTSVA
jgi:Uma2 family endonuclease